MTMSGRMFSGEPLPDANGEGEQDASKRSRQPIKVPLRSSRLVTALHC